MDSILTSVKKDLGITADYTHFDDDIIMDINVAFSTLMQLGVGPATGFSISDASAVWTDFIPDSPTLNLVKKYVAAKARVLFDPPQSSSLLEAYNNTISELEWRINVSVDPANTFD